MLKSRLTNPLLQIHIAVFLWGFTAILGKLISLETPQLVALRMTIAAVGYFLLPRTKSSVLALSFRKISYLLLIGVIICIHWLCFYQSIKEYNSSSIALVCLGTGPLFVLWIEYLLRIKKSISPQQILISIVALLGMYCISIGNSTQSFQMETFGSFEKSIFYGVMAAMLAAVFTILNSRATTTIEPLAISFVEMLSGAIVLWIFHIGSGGLNFLYAISISDGVYILILSIVCTCIPFLLSIYSLKKLDPFIVTLSVNLEPIYGLLFAAILFQEYKGFNTYFFLGAGLILFSVFLPNIWSPKKASQI